MITVLILCSLFVLLMVSSARADEDYSEDIAGEIRGFLLDDD